MSRDIPLLCGSDCIQGADQYDQGIDRYDQMTERVSGSSGSQYKDDAIQRDGKCTINIYPANDPVKPRCVSPQCRNCLQRPKKADNSRDRRVQSKYRTPEWCSLKIQVWRHLIPELKVAKERSLPVTQSNIGGKEPLPQNEDDEPTYDYPSKDRGRRYGNILLYVGSHTHKNIGLYGRYT
jgi:hypothetical protein